MSKAGSNRPKISIVVPVYHVEQYLRRCLDSILNQSFDDFELIVVNDGGNEAETSICEKYAKSDDRIVYIHQENAGLSAARNAGLDICRGDWIMFVDSDDWVHPDFCAKALASVEGTAAHLGIFDLVYTLGNETTGQAHRSQLATGQYDSLTILKARLCGDVVGYAWNKVYHSSLWETVRFPVGECWEDDAVMDEIIDSSPIISIIHDVLYYKPGRSDNITSIACAKAEDSKWLYIQRRKRYDFLKANHPELLDLVQTNMAMTAMLYGIYCIHYVPNKDKYAEARTWARQEKLSPRDLKPHTHFAYLCFLHCTPLFRIATLLWVQKREKHIREASRAALRAQGERRA